MKRSENKFSIIIVYVDDINIVQTLIKSLLDLKHKELLGPEVQYFSVIRALMCLTNYTRPAIVLHL